MWNEMYEMLLPELEECQNRGCKILGVCHNIQNPMDGIEIHHSGKYHDMTEKLHWFIISADGRKLLYGYSAETDRDAFYTEDVSHIYLLEDYIMHDMVINRFISEYKKEIPIVEHGSFGAHMEVSLVNDGPFTIILE